MAIAGESDGGEESNKMHEAAPGYVSTLKNRWDKPEGPSAQVATPPRPPERPK